MNPITQQVIEFLTHPELPFGAEEDLVLLDDPTSFRDQVSSLLEENPEVLGAQNSGSLKFRLDEADWAAVANEFRSRVQIASKFFEADLKTDN